MLLKRAQPCRLRLEAAREKGFVFLRWAGKMVGWAIRWSLVVVMFTGASYMWPSVINATIVGRVSPGQLTWLTYGIGLLFFQAFMSAELARNTKSKPERVLRWAIFCGVWLNVLGNFWVDVLLWRGVFTGTIPITPQDTVTAWICSISLLCIMCWAMLLGQSVLDPLPMFLLAVFSRVIPQGAMVAAERMALVYNTCLGLLLISSQRVVAMGIETWRAGRKNAKLHTLKTERALDAAQWILLSDIANWMTAAMIFSAWIIQH